VGGQQSGVVTVHAALRAAEQDDTRRRMVAPRVPERADAGRRYDRSGEPWRDATTVNDAARDDVCCLHYLDQQLVAIDFVVVALLRAHRPDQTHAVGTGP